MKSRQRLTDADIDLVDPWIPADVARQQLTAVVPEARNAVDESIESRRLGLSRKLGVREASAHRPFHFLGSRGGVFRVSEDAQAVRIQSLLNRLFLDLFFRRRLGRLEFDGGLGPELPVHAEFDVVLHQEPGAAANAH